MSPNRTPSGHMMVSVFFPVFASYHSMVLFWKTRKATLPLSAGQKRVLSLGIWTVYSISPVSFSPTILLWKCARMIVSLHTKKSLTALWAILSIDFSSFPFLTSQSLMLLSGCFAPVNINKNAIKSQMIVQFARNKFD